MNSLRNINAIAKRELGGYFSSPVAYVFIVIFLLLTGFFTFSMGHFFEAGQANLESFFRWHAWLYLFLVPCVGMRLWAEERRVGTIELLLTKPITAWQAILGKFLASWIFLGLALALTFPIVITVNYLGSPDNGLIIGAYIGSMLMAGTYLAISSMTSALTRNQVVSFIISVVICLFLVLCGVEEVTGYLTRLDKPWVVDLVSSFSVMTHFQPFTTGMVDSRDVIFFLLIIGFALFTNGVIIRSHQASTDKLMKRKTFERVLYSTGGVAAMFIVMLAFYVVTSAVKVRLDITADKAHTLSPGTKKILGRLDSRVTLRFYSSQSDNAMPPVLKTYALRIDDLLHEFSQEAATHGKGQLQIEKYDPKPDSEAEDSARLNGIEGHATGPFGSDKIYLGVVVSVLDQKFTLPFLAPDRERLLEYDLARAIAHVTSHAQPVVGIMSGLPIWCEAFNPMMHPGETRAEDWAFVSELKKDFTVKRVPMTATNIDPDVKLLLVAHPVEITDASQYAIDQFVMRGGKLFAFVDPHAYFDQSHERSKNFIMGGDNAAKSSLDKLFRAWGLEMSTEKVAADRSFAGRNNQSGDIMPTLLLITRAGINEAEVATSQIDNMFLPFAGVFTGKVADGLKETVLVKCSPNSELVDTLMASAGNEILKSFKAANIEYPVAIQLTGKFKTGFPNGGGLKESPAGTEVVLVSDTDMLNDKVCVSIQNVMGHRVVRPVNGNLNFVQSVVEEMAGDDDLISARSRASMSRPFTRVKDMEAKAGKQWEEKVAVLESKKRDMEKKIRELQSHNEGGQGKDLILSPAQEQELETSQKAMVEVGRELKEVRKNLRKDTDALEFRTKVINIATMPALVALTGLFLALFKTKKRGAK